MRSNSAERNPTTSTPPETTLLQIMLETVWLHQALTQEALARSEPDQPAVKRYMTAACKAGRRAARYVQNEELQRRLMSDEPMSQQDWIRLWPDANKFFVLDRRPPPPLLSPAPGAPSPQPPSPEIEVTRLVVPARRRHWRCRCEHQRYNSKAPIP